MPITLGAKLDSQCSSKPPRNMEASSPLPCIGREMPSAASLRWELSSPTHKHSASTRLLELNLGHVL